MSAVTILVPGMKHNYIQYVKRDFKIKKINVYGESPLSSLEK